MPISSPMTDPTSQIRDLVKRLTGIDLGDAKRAMVEGRLGKRLRELDVDVAAYAKRLASDKAEQAIVIDLLTTNHTAWMREPAHFTDFANRVIPQVAARRTGGRPTMRLWCAATATGEEPYTIALTLARTLPDLAAWDVAMLATDISQRALATARAAEYGEERVATLSEADRQLALDLVDRGPPKRYRVKPNLRGIVNLARLNLMEEWPMRGPFDAIFCRNVMIYFDRPTQERLVNRLAKLLCRGGTLYVGHSESLNAITHPLRAIGPAAYVA